MNGSRDKESEMLSKLRDYYGVSDTEILEHVLGVLSADDTCYALNEMLEEIQDGNR